ncbi:unnamed protein product [Allacma fusca]|uniref:DUF5641 domain-containing protein n=1 Tax=Allacma fusca TaxID=39272 RepID=A0A8J2L0I5_9HEXA|nr:unnamed protein product [Allacma fusca]
MARVMEVYPGNDGVIRVVKVRAALGDVWRPIQRLYVFEVGDEDRTELLVLEKLKQVDQESPIETAGPGTEFQPLEDIREGVVITRCGRKFVLE